MKIFSNYDCLAMKRKMQEWLHKKEIGYAPIAKKKESQRLMKAMRKLE